MTRTSLCVLLIVMGAGTAEAEVPRVGVMIDAGVPDGGTASLVYRPLSRVRLSAGVSHNLIGPGVRGGVTLSPLDTWIRPTLSGTYGRFFERDANPIARMLSGDDSIDNPALERVGYQYADAHLGLEMGKKRFTFYLHAGVTRINGRVRNLAELAEGDAGAMTDESGTTVTFTEDPTVTMTTLSARFGLVVYIL